LCVYITLDVFLVIVFRDGNPLAGLFIFSVMTVLLTVRPDEVSEFSNDGFSAVQFAL
jgi:hypothetical protein